MSLHAYWEGHPASYRFFHNRTAVVSMVILIVIMTLSILVGASTALIRGRLGTVLEASLSF